MTVRTLIGVAFLFYPLVATKAWFIPPANQSHKEMIHGWKEHFGFWPYFCVHILISAAIALLMIFSGSTLHRPAISWFVVVTLSVSGAYLSAIWFKHVRRREDRNELSRRLCSQVLISAILYFLFAGWYVFRLVT